VVEHLKGITFCASISTIGYAPLCWISREISIFDCQCSCEASFSCSVLWGSNRGSHTFWSPYKLLWWQHSVKWAGPRAISLNLSSIWAKGRHAFVSVLGGASCRLSALQNIWSMYIHEPAVVSHALNLYSITLLGLRYLTLITLASELACVEFR